MRPFASDRRAWEKSEWNGEYGARRRVRQPPARAPGLQHTWRTTTMISNYQEIGLAVQGFGDHALDDLPPANYQRHIRQRLPCQDFAYPILQ
jgi:hypothetical protein